ncbi:pre-mRNA-processing factor 19 [Strigomonas culicis]|uniref:Pre-mRNA-processing factor 19 n=1 Tax=Strigomonas culicis TaxID=28005 RepID=S9UGK7_9TRYP|nr:pre-mRNA-processing factor 19 [Strigomonas culicis]|eukprot:EPY28048.1 pre-mRNA-processing factor 19 [Strigomonas culicis]
MQQELAHALQRHEAACYVIAGLQRECDALRQGAPAPGEAPAGVPDAVTAAMAQQEARCREDRRRRKGQPAPGRSRVTVSHDFAVGSGTAHCVCGTADHVYVAGTAEAFGVVRYDLGRQCVAAVGRGHTNSVHTLAAAGDALASAAADGTVRVWRGAAEQLHCAHTLRFASGVRAMGRRLIGGQYALCATAGDALALADLDSGVTLLTTDPTTDGGTFSAVEVHPYGTLAAVGTSGGRLALHDLRQMAEDTTVHVAGADVRQIDFSVDCFSVAAALRSGAVLVWDLRQLDKPLHTVPARGEDGVPAYAAFDTAAGRHLAIASGRRLELRDMTQFDAVASELTVEKGLFSGLAWAPDGRHMVSCSVDGVVQVYQTE